MKEPEFHAAFSTLAGEMGLALQEAWIPSFFQHLTLMVKWNQKVNLTSITDPIEAIVKHFLDSLAICELIPREATVLDLGSGAGFPGVPVKVARPDLELTLAESSTKRRVFLLELQRTLGLDDVRVVPGLDPGKPDPSLMGRFDVVLSRAVGSLDRLASMAKPFLAEGGMVLALKGPSVRRELDTLELKRSENGRSVLEPKELLEFELPRDFGRRIVLALYESNIRGG